LDARVKPGKGGTLWLSWGAPFEGEGAISEWEPGKRFQWVEERPAAEKGADPVRIVVDFHLESRGGKTILRLVQSGFGDSQSWNDEFDATSQGWGWCFAALRHYLEQQLGRRRTATFGFAMVPAERRDAWTKLTGASGFRLASGSFASLKPGDRYALVAGPHRFEGRVLLCKPDYYFGGTLENLGNGLLWIEVNRSSGSSMPALLFSTFGEPTPATAAAHDWMKPSIDRLFPKPKE
ncbi:MAG TPA: SRPBCC domain-containing protein, partial [Planctomycetota bacterium]|nr:SRPBCC domain-containing protein [Planctomycetota bacterium]